MMLDIIKSLCNSRGISINKLETELGFSQGSIGKMGDSMPKADRLHKIADYFDVPMEYFFDEEEAIRKIQDNLQKEIDELVKDKPLYRVAAGEGCYNGTYADETIEADDGCEYAKVIGDSMYPTLHDGDTVKILRQTETTPHDYTLVKVDGEHATIKYVEIVSDGVWLRAENKEVYEDRFFSIQEVMTLPVTIIGKVVELRRSL